jgi:hypothetical protein
VSEGRLHPNPNACCLVSSCLQGNGKRVALQTEWFRRVNYDSAAGPVSVSTATSQFAAAPGQQVGGLACFLHPEPFQMVPRVPGRRGGVQEPGEVCRRARLNRVPHPVIVPILGTRYEFAPARRGLGAPLEAAAVTVGLASLQEQPREGRLECYRRSRRRSRGEPQSRGTRLLCILHPAVHVGVALARRQAGPRLADPRGEDRRHHRRGRLTNSRRAAETPFNLVLEARPWQPRFGPCVIRAG